MDVTPTSSGTVLRPLTYDEDSIRELYVDALRNGHQWLALHYDKIWDWLLHDATTMRSLPCFMFRFDDTANYMSFPIKYDNGPSVKGRTFLVKKYYIPNKQKAEFERAEDGQGLIERRRTWEKTEVLLYTLAYLYPSEEIPAPMQQYRPQPPVPSRPPSEQWKKEGIVPMNNAEQSSYDMVMNAAGATGEQCKRFLRAIVRHYRGPIPPFVIQFYDMDKLLFIPPDDTGAFPIRSWLLSECYLLAHTYSLKAVFYTDVWQWYGRPRPEWMGRVPRPYYTQKPGPVIDIPSTSATSTTLTLGRLNKETVQALWVRAMDNRKSSKSNYFQDISTKDLWHYLGTMPDSEAAELPCFQIRFADMDEYHYVPLDMGNYSVRVRLVQKIYVEYLQNVQRRRSDGSYIRGTPGLETVDDILMFLLSLHLKTGHARLPAAYPAPMQSAPAFQRNPEHAVDPGTYAIYRKLCHQEGHRNVRWEDVASIVNQTVSAVHKSGALRWRLLQLDEPLPCFQFQFADCPYLYYMQPDADLQSTLARTVSYLSRSALLQVYMQLTRPGASNDNETVCRMMSIYFRDYEFVPPPERIELPSVAAIADAEPVDEEQALVATALMEFMQDVRHAADPAPVRVTGEELERVQRAIAQANTGATVAFYPHGRPAEGSDPVDFGHNGAAFFFAGPRAPRWTYFATVPEEHVTKGIVKRTLTGAPVTHRVNVPPELREGTFTIGGSSYIIVRNRLFTHEEYGLLNDIRDRLGATSANDDWRPFLAMVCRAFPEGRFQVHHAGQMQSGQGISPHIYYWKAMREMLADPQLISKADVVRRDVQRILQGRRSQAAFRESVQVALRNSLALPQMQHLPVRFYVYVANQMRPSDLTSGLAWSEHFVSVLRAASRQL